MPLHDSARSHEIQTIKNNGNEELNSSNCKYGPTGDGEKTNSINAHDNSNGSTTSITKHPSNTSIMRPLPQCVDKSSSSTTLTHQSNSVKDPSNVVTNDNLKQSSNVEQSTTSLVENKAPAGTNEIQQKDPDSDSDTQSEVSDHDEDNDNDNDDNNENNYSSNNNSNNTRGTTSNRDTQKQQTITQIINYLKDYKVNDDLDEDEIIPTITKMNAASKNRRRHRRWLMRDHSKGDTIDHKDTDLEECWNDDDLIMMIENSSEQVGEVEEKKNKQKQKEQPKSKADLNQMYLHAMINVVDDNFFADTIENIEEGCTHLLDENVIQNLRQSLAMKGKGLVRKRRDILVVVNEEEELEDEQQLQQQQQQQVSDSSHVKSSDESPKNRRRTRRMIQESKEKKNGNHEELIGLNDLIGAMIEIEEEEGRSINTNFDDFIHQARKLRVRKKDPQKETSKKRDMSPMSADGSDVNQITQKKKKKKTTNSNTNNNGRKSSPSKASSPLSEENGVDQSADKEEIKMEEQENDDSLYAILPEDYGRRRSARRSLEQKVMKVNSVIVEGKPFEIKADKVEQEEEEKKEEAELNPDGTKKKRAYKKRRNYGKRGPYKKRKKADDDATEVEVKPKVAKKTPPVPKIKPTRVEIESDDESTDTTLECEDSGPVSLNLLDWRRRQKCPEQLRKDKAEKFATATNAYLSSLTGPHTPGLETSMVSWDSINLHTEGDVDRQPTMEPPRKRTTNYLYGRWCNQLLHCLQGRGRLFARNEFFYSDVDKAWYNENKFAKDLAEIGVPVNSKLTRAEWSMVRRKIRKRPRLFSKKFIASQMQQLEQYREAVRKIQQGQLAKVLAENEDFCYEVLAPPKIGTVVTAYNKRAKMLHRGTVLAHHRRMNFFLVQFERKELSWDWVRDTDVASHGLPEVILPQAKSNEVEFGKTSFLSTKNLGSIVSGTKFGQLIDFYKREFQLSAKKAKMRQMLSQLKNGSTVDTTSENESFSMQTIAEREALVKIMNTIESNLERKRVILDAINDFHIIGADGISKNEVFKNHYVWLHENLSFTEEALESALVHQQILYSKIYTGTTMVPNNDKQVLDTNYRSAKNVGKKNDLIIQTTAKEIADELMTQIVDPSNSKDVFSARKSFLSNRISSATGVMLINDLLQRNKELLRTNVSDSITDEVSRLSTIKIPDLPPELIDASHARNAALDDLKDSLRMLESELHQGSMP